MTNKRFVIRGEKPHSLPKGFDSSGGPPMGLDQPKEVELMLS